MRILIVDDDLLSRKVIYKFGKNVDPEIYIFEAKCVVEGLKLFKQKKPDLVFLDYQMPNGTGADFLELVNNHSAEIVMITPYPQEDLPEIVKTIDFIPKLLPPQTYRRKIIKKIKQVKYKKENKTTSQAKINEYNWDKVLYLKAMGSYTKIYFDDNKKHLLSKNLAKIENKLPYSMFCRVHRSYIVNLNYIKDYP